MRREDNNGNPGAGGDRAGAKKGSDGINGRENNPNANRSLPLELADIIDAESCVPPPPEVAIALRSLTDEQLKSFPRILELVNPALSDARVAFDAQSLANCTGESVMIIDARGRVIAFAEPL